MNSLFRRLEKEWGYMPTLGEVWDLYTSGGLNLTDEEEDSLLIQYEKAHE
jgi:hypothetical protein